MAMPDMNVPQSKFQGITTQMAVAREQSTNQR